MARLSARQVDRHFQNDFTEQDAQMEAELQVPDWYDDEPMSFMEDISDGYPRDELDDHRESVFDRYGNDDPWGCYNLHDDSPF